MTTPEVPTGVSGGAPRPDLGAQGTRRDYLAGLPDNVRASAEAARRQLGQRIESVNSGNRQDEDVILLGDSVSPQVIDAAQYLSMQVILARPDPEMLVALVNSYSAEARPVVLRAIGTTLVDVLHPGGEGHDRTRRRNASAGWVSTSQPEDLEWMIGTLNLIQQGARRLGVNDLLQTPGTGEIIHFLPDPDTPAGYRFENGPVSESVGNKLVVPEAGERGVRLALVSQISDPDSLGVANVVRPPVAEGAEPPGGRQAEDARTNVEAEKDRLRPPLPDRIRPAGWFRKGQDQNVAALAEEWQRDPDPGNLERRINETVDVIMDTRASIGGDFSDYSFVIGYLGVPAPSEERVRTAFGARIAYYMDQGVQVASDGKPNPANPDNLDAEVGDWLATQAQYFANKPPEELEEGLREYAYCFKESLRVIVVAPQAQPPAVDTTIIGPSVDDAPADSPKPAPPRSEFSFSDNLGGDLLRDTFFNDRLPVWGAPVEGPPRTNDEIEQSYQQEVNRVREELNRRLGMYRDLVRSNGGQRLDRDFYRVGEQMSFSMRFNQDSRESLGELPDIDDLTQLLINGEYTEGQLRDLHLLDTFTEEALAVLQYEFLNHMMSDAELRMQGLYSVPGTSLTRADQTPQGHKDWNKAWLKNKKFKQRWLENAVDAGGFGLKFGMTSRHLLSSHEDIDFWLDTQIVDSEHNIFVPDPNTLPGVDAELEVLVDALRSRVNGISSREFGLPAAEDIVALTNRIIERGGLDAQEQRGLADTVEIALSGRRISPVAAFSDVFFQQIERFVNAEDVDGLRTLRESAKLLGLYRELEIDTATGQRVEEGELIPALTAEFDRYKVALEGGRA